MPLDAKSVAQSLSRLERINSNLEDVLIRLKQQEATDSILRELIEELSTYLSVFEEDLFKLNQAVLYILSDNVSDKDTAKLRESVISDRVQILTDKREAALSQLKIWHKNLSDAQIDDAKYAGMSPPNVRTAIDDAREKIAQLESEIGQISGQVEHLKSL